MIKKSPFIFLYALLFLVFNTYNEIKSDAITPYDSESSGRFVDEFDGFGDFDDNDFLDFEGNTETRAFTAEDILKFLLDANALEILQQDLFLKTTQLNTRSLLDMPMLGALQSCRTNKRIFNADFFYNQTTRGNFTRTSTDLESYLALSSVTLIDKIQQSIAMLKDLFPTAQIDVQRIFALFKNMTTQQRRLGLMFAYTHQHKNLIGRVITPFYYLERNLFLTPAQQAAVEDEFGAGDPQEAADFQKKYFISDKVGFGDTRLEIEGPAMRSNLVHFNVGGHLTIPTAFTIEKGMMGSSFTRPCTLPTFDFEQLFELAENAINGTEQQMQDAQEQGIDILRTLLLDALDRFSGNLIDTKLGNDGHLGVGLFYRSHAHLSGLIKRQWAEKVHFFSKVSLEYLFPAIEKRYFIKKNNPEAFAARDFRDTDQSLPNLEFLGEELINKFYLIALNTRVQPGVIIHTNNKLCYQGVQWGVHIGTDFWLQTRAHLSKIKEPSKEFHTGPPITIESLDKRKAKPFFAYQSKLFAGVTCQIERPQARWFTSLNVDSTLFNSGIGQDYTIAIKVERQF